MAKKKHNKVVKFLKTKLGMAVAVCVAVLLLVFFAYILPSSVVASSKKRAYVEKYGDTSLEELPGPGVAWTYLCINYEMISGYDDVKMTKGTHLAYGDSYNYIKYTFKANGRKYVCIYQIQIDGKYIAK